MRTILTVLSALLGLAAAPPYIADTIRRKTKPERATWLIFSILGIIAFWGQLRLGATLSLVFSGIDTLGSIVTFLLSIKFGVAGFTRIDKIGLGVALIGLIISLEAHEPVIAILGVVLADSAGTALTIRKTFLDPDSETTIAWMLFATGSVFAMFAVGKLDFGLLLYPAYLAVANYAIPVAQFVGRRHKLSAKDLIVPKR